MNREIAEKIMLELDKLGDVLNDMALIIENVVQEEEKQMLRKGLGELMAKSFTDITLPIIREYPDLDPDKDSEWFKELKKKQHNKNA